MDSRSNGLLEACSDAELIRRSRRNSQAFGVLFDRHAKRLQTRTARLVDPDTAADVVGETFARAWTHRRRFRDPGDGSAAGWLAQITLNVLRDYWRHEQVRTRGCERLGMQLPMHDEDPYPRCTERIDAQGRLAALQSLIEGLSVPRREALVLRVVDELTYAQIAERQGCSQSAARLRVSRALRALRVAQETAVARSAPPAPLTS